MDFKNGAVVEGKYETEGTLGKGGMGVVYRAKNLRTGELVALKVLHPRFADRPGLAKRLRTVAPSPLPITIPITIGR